MKTARILTLALAAAAGLAGCRSGPGADAAVGRFSPLRATEAVEDLAPYIAELEVLPVGADSVAKPGIMKILFSDPIVFLQGGAVYSASPDWREVTRIGNAGRGPGEYLTLKDIVINAAGDEVWCMDVLNAVLRYDLRTGAYLGKIECEQSAYARAMIPLDQNGLALYTPNPQETEGFFCLNYYDSSGRLTDSELPWTQFNVMAAFSVPVSVTGEDRYVLTPESSNISYVFRDGRVDRQLLFDFERKWIPSKFFDPKAGDPAERVGDLFDMDCYKLVSSVFFPEGEIYFNAFGKDSSSWNFILSEDGTHGIRWRSVGVMTPPIKAVACDGTYLFFVYDDYGYVDVEPDPLKKCVIDRLGLPDKKDQTYLIKVKFAIDR